MNYIVLDMEWNQPYSSQGIKTRPVRLCGEIVQMGAVKLDSELHMLDTFKIMVTPKYYKKMNKRIARLTKITAEELESGVRFPEAFRRFKEWCGEDIVILTWGPDDIPMLRDNMAAHRIDTAWIPRCYDLQIIFDAQISHENRQISLSDAAARVDEPEFRAHDALNDAMNTARICPHLDLAAGFKDYEQICKTQYVKSLQDCDFGKTYKHKSEALGDAEMTHFECPICKKGAKCGTFVSQNPTKKVTLATCEDGHELFVRIKFNPLRDKTYRATRLIYEMTDEYRELYETHKSRVVKYRKTGDSHEQRTTQKEASAT